jgi:tetratricopeptide (TPR) repeat protein
VPLCEGAHDCAGEKPAPGEPCKNGMSIVQDPKLGTAAQCAPPEQALRALEHALARDPASLELRRLRAGALHLLGREDEAKNAYLQVLQHDPDHLGALRELAQVLAQTGFRSAARTLLERAVARHPTDLASHVNLAVLRFESDESQAARALFERALQLAPDNPQAHAGLSLVLDRLDEPAAAALHRQRGFARHSVHALPYRGTGEPLRVLLLGATNSGNVPIQRHLDDRTFQTWIVTPEFHDAREPLPAHALVVNAIGDADAAAPALRAAGSLLARTRAPVINAPLAVAATGRCANWLRLGALPGVVVPRAATLRRQALGAADAAATLRRNGLNFPLLLRSPGFHTGEHFVRVDDGAALTAALAALPGSHLIAIEFLNARGPDGKTRKYRVMMVDGQLYPLHLAVAHDWKVHYFSADMADNPAHRAEDERFLGDMAGTLGARAMDTLRRIQARMGLDYAGIDFALGAEGQIVLFEANATMVVPPPAHDPRWAYRRAAVGRVDAAVQRMLRTRAGAPVAPMPVPQAILPAEPRGPSA